MRTRYLREMLALVVCATAIGVGENLGAVEYKVTLLPVDLRKVFVNSTDGIDFGGYSQGDAWRAIILDGKLENQIDLHPDGFHSSSVENISGEYQVGWANESGGIYAERATLWNGSAESAISLHPDRFQASYALDVSGEYQVGWGALNNGLIQRALLWKGTAESVVELTPQGFVSSIANAVSGSTQAGYAVPDRPTGTPRAMLWHGTAESYVDLHPDGLSQFSRLRRFR